MALVPLFDEVNQFNDYNGTVLAAGKLYVYHLGRTRLADIYSDIGGTVMQNPVTLDNLGRGPIYVSQDFNYTLVVMDEYGQEMFSQDKFIYSQGGPHNSANVAVGASEYIAVSSTQIGDTTVYTPYLTGAVPGSGSGGKTYHGIDPIVVNNVEDKISANTVPFGVQEPLYFVEDETATIIGLSGNPSADAVNWVTAQGYLRSPDLIGYATKDFVEGAVSGKLDESAFATVSGSFLTGLPEGTMNESGFEYDGTAITGYDGSAFKAGDEFPQSATEAVELVTSNSASWNDVSGKLDTTAFSNVSGDFYTTANPSGFITGVDLSPYQTTAGMTGYATKDDISGLASADDWNGVVETVSSNSASWNDVENKLDTTATGNFYLTSNPSGFITDSDISNKLDTTAFSTVSGSFLTAIPSDVVKTGDLTASSNWDSTYNTVYTYSSTWTGGGTARPVLPVTGVSGIQVQESGDQIVFSYTGNTVPAGVLVESGLDFDSDNKITGYSGSAFAGGADYSAGKNISIAGDVISTTDTISVTGDVQVENSIETEVTSKAGTIWGTNYYGHYASLNSSYKVTVSGTPANLGIYVYDFDYGGYYVNGLTTADLQNFTITGLSSLPNAVTSKQGDWSTTDWFEGAEFGIDDRTYNPESDEGMPAWPVSSTLYSLVGSNISLSGLNNFIETNSASWTASGPSYTGDAQGALNEVYTNSATWNDTTDVVSSSSAGWGGQGIEISAGFGIDIQTADNKLLISVVTATGEI